MAISIDWPTGVITIPQSDLTLVTGTLYELDTNWFRLQLKDLEDSEEGIVWPVTHVHNTEVTVAGTTFFRTVEILSPYSVTFENTGSDYSVRLAGSNNNIFDVENGILNSTPGVTVIAQNSAGNIVVETGVSGLTQAESDALLEIAVDIDAIESNIATVAGAITLIGADIGSIEASLINIDGNITTIQGDITSIEGNVTTITGNVSSMLATLTDIDERELGQHITSQDDGKLIIRNTAQARRWEAMAWEDEARTIPYRGRGLEVVDDLVEVVWS
jgi:hypothetical protein